MILTFLSLSVDPVDGRRVACSIFPPSYNYTIRSPSIAIIWRLRDLTEGLDVSQGRQIDMSSPNGRRGYFMSGISAYETDRVSCIFVDPAGSAGWLGSRQDL